MVKVSIIVCVLALWAFAGVNCATKSAAPAPSVDCSTIIFTMADCLTFVTNGSKITKPEGGCCSGLKTVLKTDAQCLCQTFANSGSLGIALDMKKALTLPKACGVSAPSFSNCNLPGVPGASPASAPKSSAPTSSTPVSPAATPEASAGGSGSTGNILSPAPAQSHAASSFSVSFVTLIASLVVASSCSTYLF